MPHEARGSGAQGEEHTRQQDASAGDSLHGSCYIYARQWADIRAHPTTSLCG
ncbi:MAG: hypothetical protein ACPIOQ_28195 [Promethearchaeia archaeon]